MNSTKSIKIDLPTLWDAFLEDYAAEIFNWSLRFTLEVFWHYCQDGSQAVHEFLNRKAG